MSIESDGSASPSGLGAAPRAFLRLSAGGATLVDGEVSRARKLAALGFSVLVLTAVPLLWITAGADQAVAVTAGKSGPGHGGDEDDGPGDDTAGEDDDLTDSRTSGDGVSTATRPSGAETNTGTGRGDTRNSTRGGTTGTNTGTTRGARETAGTTQGGTSVKETRTTHGGQDTRGTTRGPTEGTNTGTGRGDTGNTTRGGDTN